MGAVVHAAPRRHEDRARLRVAVSDAGRRRTRAGVARRPEHEGRARGARRTRRRRHVAAVRELRSRLEAGRRQRPSTCGCASAARPPSPSPPRGRSSPTAIGRRRRGARHLRDAAGAAASGPNPAAIAERRLEVSRLPGKRPVAERARTQRRGRVVPGEGRRAESRSSRSRATPAEPSARRFASTRTERSAASTSSCLPDGSAAAGVHRPDGQSRGIPRQTCARPTAPPRRQSPSRASPTTGRAAIPAWRCTATNWCSPGWTATTGSSVRTAAARVSGSQVNSLPRASARFCRRRDRSLRRPASRGNRASARRRRRSRPTTASSRKPVSTRRHDPPALLQGRAGRRRPVLRPARKPGDAGVLGAGAREQRGRQRHRDRLGARRPDRARPKRLDPCRLERIAADRARRRVS